MAEHIGKGTKLSVESLATPGTFITLCFIELTEAEPEIGETETTSSCTPGKDKTFIPTLIDNGTLEATGLFDDDAAELAKIDELRTSFKTGEMRNFRIEREQSTPVLRKEFSAFFKKFIGPKYDGREETQKVMMSMRVSGPVVETQVTP